MRTKTQEEKVQFSVERIRDLFPVLHQEVNGHPLVYFDNAATAQKPKAVLEALKEYYEFDNANIHRGIHTLAEKATAEYEASRASIASFLNAAEKEEIIFTSGATAGLNLVAQTYGRKFLKEGDEVIISAMEHHSNIVPWQLVCEEKGAVLKVIPLLSDGSTLDLEAYKKLLNKKTALVAVTQASNTLGTVNPVKEMIEWAHEVDAVVAVDAAQSVVHLPIDVQELNCDFLAYSGHKMYGPTGTGVLYGKRALLEAMPPWQGGGEMIDTVSFEKSTFNDIPYKFEAGTQNIAGVVALKTAVEFMNSLDFEEVEAHEKALEERATWGLEAIEGIRLIGTAKEKIGVVSFVSEYVHHFDMGMMLDTRGVAIRTGHHCTEPLMDLLKIEGTNRASFAVYNTLEEVEILLDAVERIQKRRKR